MKFAAADPLTPRAVEQMVLGVSTRKYVRSIEPAPPEIKTRGTSKSAVSRRFVASTREKLGEMMSRDLGKIALCAIMVDGIHVAEHLVLVALGIDEKGNKHTLGLYEGATENTTCCIGLLSDLEARGVRTDRAMLFVIDGSKALAKAIRAEVRNARAHPEMPGPQEAQRKHLSAAASLREGLDETLTVMRFALPDHLARTLSTTNPIEFLNGRIRNTTHNVAKWKGGEMVLRWCQQDDKVRHRRSVAGLAAAMSVLSRLRPEHC